MQKILVVCLGNICRSALAEGILLKLIKDHKIELQVDSAGTSSVHINQAPDSRSILNAARHGIDLKPLRARQFTVSDFDNFDKILVMDKSNLTNVLSLTSKEEHTKKVDLFLNMLHPGKNLEVPDPYFGNEQGFEDVFQMVYKTCQKIVGV
ncbi:MAG: low molecular weight phosphotyrosine protein phosphatase [Bacteroidota bacterium]|jgi:protein-tyrosine phosphatase|nr:low molecular weight phosphotyrosine protein phosphatase [Bacteroidota bacterium]